MGTAPTPDTFGKLGAGRKSDTGHHGDTEGTENRRKKPQMNTDAWKATPYRPPPPIVHIYRGQPVATCRPNGAYWNSPG